MGFYSKTELIDMINDEFERKLSEKSEKGLFSMKCDALESLLDDVRALANWTWKVGMEKGIREQFLLDHFMKEYGFSLERAEFTLRKLDKFGSIIYLVEVVPSAKHEHLYTGKLTDNERVLEDFQGRLVRANNAWEYEQQEKESST